MFLPNTRSGSEKNRFVICIADSQTFKEISAFSLVTHFINDCGMSVNEALAFCLVGLHVKHFLCQSRFKRARSAHQVSTQDATSSA